MGSINRCLGRNVFWSILLLAIVSFTLFNGTAFCEETILSQVEKDHAQADTLLKSQHFAEAKALFQAVAQNSSDSELAMKSLAKAARCEIRLGNLTSADQLFDKLKNDYSTHPKLIESIFYCGNSYLNSKKYNEAKNAYQLALTKSTDSDWMLKSKAKIASCQIRMGDYSSADQMINEIKSNYSQHESFQAAITGFAEQYHAQKQYEKAREYYQFILDNSTDDVLVFKALRKVAEYEIQTKNFEAAGQAVTAILNSHSKNPLFDKSVCTFADMYWRSQQFEKARDLFNFIAENNSNVEQAFNGRLRVMQCEIKLRNYVAALASFEKLHKNHSSAKAFVEKATRVCGDIMQFDGPENVLPYINRAIEVTSDVETAAKLLQFKARCHIDLGQTEQAQAVKEVIELYSDKEYYPGIQLSIAYRYRNKGEQDKATSIYNKVLQSSADENRKLDARVGLVAITVSQDNDPNVANATVTDAVELLCKDFAGHEKLGWAVFVIGEEYQIRAHTDDGKSQQQKDALHRKAISVWKKNIEEINDPEYKCLAYYYTGLSYKVLKDYQKSLTYFHKVIYEFPEDKYGARALFMIGRVYQKKPNAKPVMVAPVALATDVTDPNEVEAGVALLPVSDTGTSGSVTTVSLEPGSVIINSTKDAFEQLVEKYPNSSGAAYARQWLTRNSSK